MPKTSTGHTRTVSTLSAWSRREFLRTTVAGAASLFTVPALGLEKKTGADTRLPADLLAVTDRSKTAPINAVALERCRTYDLSTLAAHMRNALERIGGLTKFVSGKTVTVKLNITGDGRQKMARLPAARTFQTHPAMVEVLCGLLSRAGAKRIVLVESYYRRRKPEDILSRHGWDIDRIQASGDRKVTFEDTRNRGEFKDYSVLEVPFGGYVFAKYHLNRRYEDTDVFVSLAKLKNHVTAGITCAVKNLFGIAPTSLYGNDAPNEKSIENRGNVLHFSSRDVPAGVTGQRWMDQPELANKTRNEVSYFRVPRVTADLFGVRPVDLAIVEAIEAVAGGEGPWCADERPRHTTPGLIIAGTNAVTTDAVCVGVMGYDPQAGYAKHPFQGANHLDLLARAGIGSNDLARIEVRGVPLKEALYEYHPDRPEKGWVESHG